LRVERQAIVDWCLCAGKLQGFAKAVPPAQFLRKGFLDKRELSGVQGSWSNSCRREYLRRERSPVVRTFQKLDQLLDLIEALSRWNLQIPRFNFERLSGRLFGRQTEAQEMIDHLLEGISRAPLFFLEQFGDVVVEGKCGSHIMMLLHQAS
jgi:hypothetical protein